MNRIPIVFAFDSNFEMPAGVCFTSLLENAAQDTFYEIFVLHGRDTDFSGSKLNRLPEIYKNCSLTFKDVGGSFSGAYQVRGITEATYYKLLIPEFLPEYDKVLYSDVDVIFREDLRRFYDLDLGDHYFAAVDNCAELRPEAREYVTNLGLDYNSGYFYAGNLVVNSALLRADKMTETFRKMGSQTYQQQDMDIMNIACNGRILRLDPSFCLSIQLYHLIVNRRKEFEKLFSSELLERALESGIVHYNGAKPWNGACLNMDIWWDYYRRSIWFDQKFCFDFWDRQCTLLDRLPLGKRFRLLVRGLLGR
ncbi:MAG: glycosyltransferase family 8 protein [Candidatus Cryptobacteroides sp.]|jgi:UDP-glucose:(galactosyl)LPS alpha-1,2-glucosyltransferase